MERRRVLWFGRVPSGADAEQVKDHGFELVECADGRDPDCQYACAAIFWATGRDFRKAAVCLKRYVGKALNEGVYVVVVVSGEADDIRLKEVTKILEGNDPHRVLTQQYRIRSEPVSVHQLMNALLRHDAGPAKNSKLEIQPPHGLPPESQLLIQRAFHDCCRVRLTPIARGFSGADTYIVEAMLRASFAGQEVQPFFAKLGDSSKLKEEMARFAQFAEYYVPWYLRPNFLREKCLFGVSKAILVGSFVRDSVSLSECVQSGAGPQHIHSLFEETLGGLRQQSRSADEGTATSVVDALAGFSNHDRVPSKRYRRAAELFGGQRIEPETLWWQMLSLPPLSWRKSAIHGDMHGENVRVRKQDAIVIDFAQACIGPASADLANLEVWLAFECLGSGPLREEWRALIGELYSSELIGLSLEDRRRISGQHWLLPCIAEIRSLARGAIESLDEYKRVLAVYLLRQASFPANREFLEEDEYRRSFAYWLSCKLVESLCSEEHLPLGTS